MQISDERLREFQMMYKKRFKKSIDTSNAMDVAIKLVELVRLIYKPIKKSAKK